MRFPRFLSKLGQYGGCSLIAAALLGAAALTVGAGPPVEKAVAQSNVIDRRAQPTVPARGEVVRRWLEAVRAHEAGVLDEPALGIAPWSSDDLEAVLQAVLVQRDALARARRAPELEDFLSQDELARANINRLLKRGALLHADIAMSEIRIEARPARRRGPLSVRLEDGREGGVTAYAHWGVGRSLLDAIRPSPADDPDARLWYLAANAFMVSRSYLGDRHHIDRALRLFPRDPDNLFYLGCLHEAAAKPAIQRAVRMAPTKTRPMIGDARAELQRAADLFRRALEQNPRHAEAQIRFGRVLDRLERHDEAERELRQALEGAPEPMVAHYGALFLGEVLQVLRRPVEAREAYERAAASQPHAQAPWLALSHLARRLGDRAGALRALDEVRQRQADAESRLEPWAEYFEAGGRDVDARVADWRGSFATGAHR